MPRTQPPAPTPPSTEQLVARALDQLHSLVEGADAPTHLQVLTRVRSRLEEEIIALSSLEEKVRRYTARIPQAESAQELARLHSTLNGLAVELFTSDHSVTELLHLCTEYRDLIFVRALHLVETELGPPPCAYAVGSMGSEGRREQTITTDQDNMLVYHDCGQGAYFQRLASRVNELLDQVGLQRCSGGIMMGETAWQGTFADWQARIDDTFAFRGGDDGHKKQLLDLMILSDLRFIHGSRALMQKLTSYFFGRMHENVPVLFDMATACVSMPVGLGLFGKFRTEKSGKNKGRLSIKLLGWAPLILAVRVMALKDNIYETNTLRRIEALRLHHRIDEKFEAELASAYQLLTRMKIEAQIRGAGGDSDQHDIYCINPDQLTTTDRDALKQALHTVESLQKQAYHSFQLA